MLIRFPLGQLLNFPKGSIVAMDKGMQQILRLLQLNLFEKRDLTALLWGDPVRDDMPDINQLALLWKLTGQ